MINTEHESKYTVTVRCSCCTDIVARVESCYISKEAAISAATFVAIQNGCSVICEEFFCRDCTSVRIQHFDGKPSGITLFTSAGRDSVALSNIKLARGLDV